MAGSRQGICVMFVAMAMALLGSGAAAASPPSLPWESGSFAMLPLRGSGDLVVYVDSLPHSMSYTVLDPARETRVGAMFDWIQADILGTVAGNDVDWCGATAAADRAGYQLGRFYDTVSQRWLLVGADASGTGQAYFFINPEPRRDLIIEAPHVYASNAKLEGRTDTEGALLLRETMGRALLINGADRCQGPASICDGTFSSNQVCDGYTTNDRYRKSDSGHNLDSAFHVLHKKLTEISASAQFVQLHGNTQQSLPEGGISVSDGRTWKAGSGLATAFANAIKTLSNGALPASSVNDCTSGQSVLCGYQNVQGRYTNDPSVSSCNGATLKQGGTRFLHLEQRSAGSRPSLIDNPQPVSDALQAIVPCPGCSLSAQNPIPNALGACP
jgi:hypothetical protein